MKRLSDSRDSAPGRGLFGPDISLLLLAWTAGSFDAISYMRFQVFPANMTGNTVLLGIGLGLGQFQHILYSGIALFAYCLGVLLAALFIRHNEKQGPWTARLSVTLGLEVIAIFIFALCQLFFAAKNETGVVFLIALSSFAMGMQSISARSFGVAGIATTYITGTITTMVTGIASWLRAMIDQEKTEDGSSPQKPEQDQEQKNAIQGAVWLVYVLAAVVAAITEAHLPFVALLLTLLAIVLVLVNTVLHQRVFA